MRKGIENVFFFLLFFLESITLIFSIEKIETTEDDLRSRKDVTWCCLTEEELSKCKALSKAIQEDQLESDTAFGSYYRYLSCSYYTNTNECMKKIDENRKESPNIMSLNAGEIFVGGRYHSLVPILQETYAGGHDFVTAVAVIKKGTNEHIRHLRDLQGVKACFSEVSSLAGWMIPIFKLMNAKVMNISDCNNHVKSATDFFGPSCLVNSLQDRYNPLGDNSHKFCDLCASSVSSSIRCTSRDPYADFPGAFLCLQEKGDIAFLKSKTVLEYAERKEDFEILCPSPDGLLLRASIDEASECSWGTSPGRALVVSSAMDVKERDSLQRFFIRVLERYSNDSSVSISKRFILNESKPRYGTIQNLMFSDDLVQLRAIKPSQQSYQSFLSANYGASLQTPLDVINGVRQCPVSQMTLCVTSEPEMNKCLRMRTALNAQLLEPKMSCKRARSMHVCSQMISSNEADVAVMEAGDIYRAGWTFGLIPIMAEVYNLDGPYAYALAVVKQRDNSSELIYLKRKNTCHSGVGHGAGWIIPLAWLIANERVRDYGCDSLRAAGEYFSKSCAPGANSPEFLKGRVGQSSAFNHLCDLCHGTGGGYCKRNHNEDYFGHTGAFRCLVEGGGNVAFVKHTTVYENCDGKRKLWWARNQLTSDFELLCRDGTRAPATEYARCYLGKVKANAIVTNPGFSSEKIHAFINLFKYAQEHYGQKTKDEFSFSMYISKAPYADLIFQDATQQLIVLPEEERRYDAYLDSNFLRAYTTVDCESKGLRSTISTLLLFLNYFSVYIFYKLSL